MQLIDLVYLWGKSNAGQIFNQLFNISQRKYFINNCKM